MIWLNLWWMQIPTSNKRFWRLTINDLEHRHQHAIEGVHDDPLGRCEGRERMPSAVKQGISIKQKESL